MGRAPKVPSRPPGDGWELEGGMWVKAEWTDGRNPTLREWYRQFVRGGTGNLAPVGAGVPQPSSTEERGL